MYDELVQQGGGIKVGETYKSKDGRKTRTVTRMYYDDWRNCFSVIYKSGEASGDCFDRAFRKWAGIRLRT